MSHLRDFGAINRVDVRGTFPWLDGPWYYVFIAGPDRRARMRAAPGGEEGATLRFFGIAVGGFIVIQLALFLGIALVTL